MKRIKRLRQSEEALWRISFRSALTGKKNMAIINYVAGA